MSVHDDKYALRKVNINDINLLFSWRNDENVRKNSFNTSCVTYNEHAEWFNKKLNSSDSIMYIFEVNNISAGVIRLDKMEDNSLIINYSIAKEHRGKGYSIILLKMIKDMYNSYNLIGKVKSTNIASIKAFIKAGYGFEEEADTKIFYSSNEARG